MTIAGWLYCFGTGALGVALLAVGLAISDVIDGEE